MTEGQILPFYIDFKGRPYNTHTTYRVMCDTVRIVCLSVTS